MILRVMSSSVGPRPPVVITTFDRRDGIFDCFFEAGIVVADDGFEFYFDTEAIEFFGEPETVGVGAIGREQFRTNRDDFGCQRFKQARLAGNS